MTSLNSPDFTLAKGIDFYSKIDEIAPWAIPQNKRKLRQ
jgi:hypothetical protein